MSNDPTNENDNNGPQDSQHPKSIYLVAYPKIVFMYPSFLMAIGVGIYMHMSRGLVNIEPVSGFLASIGWLFLLIFAANFVVISFDFPRTTSLTLFFLILAGALGIYVLLTTFPNLIPILKMIPAIHPTANAQFYYTMAAVLGLMFLLVKISVQFDYWEVRPNELLHHHGFLSDLERFAAPNLRIDKEINDLFEFMLLRSGRLILHPSNERRAIVLDNVFFIGNKEKQITRMLGALQVQVRTDSTES